MHFSGWRLVVDVDVVVVEVKVRHNVVAVVVNVDGLRLGHNILLAFGISLVDNKQFNINKRRSKNLLILNSR